MGQQAIEFQQIMIHYIPNEDRIVMRLNSSDDQQFAVAFSRRFVKTFWGPLIYVLSADPKFSAYDEATKQAAMEFKNEEIMSKADKATPFKLEGVTYPWGKDPLVVTKAIVKNPEGALPILGLYAENDLGFEFPSNHHVLHYLYKAIMNMMKDTGWDLDLNQLAQSMPKDKNKLN